MNKRHDLDKIFRNFHGKLEISDQDNSTFVGTRRDVRAHLRQSFKREKVKFITQGSYAYHTLVKPSHTPPQQMDLDDGAYFDHFALANESGGAVTPEELFDKVDDALDSLARRKGWDLDTSKSTCCRLVISKDMHIDIPLYAIEGELDPSREENFVSLYEEARIPYHPRAGRVLLAHRKEGWIDSDPRRIIDWVLGCRKKYGKQFLRVCCYFKAWRDHQWKKSPMKSLLIMKMVADAFDENQFQNRDDDEVVLDCAGHIRDYLESGGVADPSDESKQLDRNISPDERGTIIKKLESLYKDMESALCDSKISKEEACKLMQEQFGRWFPRDFSSIVVCGGVAGGVSPTPVRPNPPWAE